MQQLTGMDTMFFGLESDSNPMILATFDICKPKSAARGRAAYQDILELFQNRIQRLSMLRRRLLRVPLNLDYPYWVEHEAFDLEQHFCRVSLPNPGTWQQLMQTVARLHNKPLDPTLPLWDVYVIEGINKVADLPKGCFAVYMRMHHAFADGATTMAIREVLFDKSPDGGIEDAVEPRKIADSETAAKVPGTARLLALACLNTASRAVNTGRDLLGMTPVLLRHGINLTQESMRERTKAPIAGVRTPKTRLNTDRMTTQRLVDARKFDFASVRAIRAHVKGSTINDVVLAIVSGALRRYLALHDDLPAQPLTCMVPINLRKDKSTGGSGNVVSGMTLPIHQEIEDPQERLKAIHKESARAKEATAMEVNKRMMEAVSGLPYPLLSIPLWAMVGRTDRVLAIPASTAVSNVPSFPEPRYLVGAEIVYLMGVGMLMPGVGTTHGFTVYNGQLIIGFITTPDVMPETSSYMACLEESFAEYDALGREVQ